MQLPYRRFVKSLVLEPYWPDSDPAMPWVCDACGHYASCADHDLRWVAEEELLPLPRTRGFWRVEVPCGAPGCGFTVVAHVQTVGQTTRRNLGLMLAKASPTPSCDAGHVLTEASSYPGRTDFVEWNGPDQYLT